MMLRMTSVARQMLVVALLLATVVGLFVAAQVGERRLENATARIELEARRQQALTAVTQLVREAESSQRGYILIGKPDYLAPYQQAVAAFALAVQHLDTAFAGAGTEMRGDVEQLERLSDRKFDEMQQTIELFAMRGRAAATQVIRSGEGEYAMSEIDDL